MKKRTLLLVIAAFAVPAATLAGVYWISRPEKAVVQRVNDVTKAQTLTFHRANSQTPSTIILRVRGQINGKARFRAANWEAIEISGKINELRGGDYFQTTYVVEYEPQSVQSGELTFEVLFE